MESLLLVNVIFLLPLKLIINYSLQTLQARQHTSANVYHLVSLIH